MAQVAAGVVQGVGQLAQGAGEANAYQSNARAALQQTEIERQASYMKAAGIQRQISQVAGAQQAAYGHAGVAPSLWVAMDSAHQGAMARAAALYQGRAGAAAQLREADIQHAQATGARTGSYLGAAGTVLGSIAQAEQDAFKAAAGGGGG